MINKHPTLALVAIAALLGGCASQVKLDEKAAPVESRTATPVSPSAQNPSANTAPTAQSNVATVDLAKQAAFTPPADRIVYFDFDSFVIKDDFKPLIDGHAKALSSAKGKRVVIEGHTDERGGREYNLALGQKRAEAVARSLVLLGVAENQLEAVSFGEERPAAQGSDESAWAKNRRAELKDR